jgi:hypothetical protein
MGLELIEDISTRTEYKILVRKYEAKRPLARIRRKWENNIKNVLKVMACEDVN